MGILMAFQHKDLSVGQNIHFLLLTFLNKSIFWWFDKMGILKANGDSFIGRKIQKQSDPIFGGELKERIKNDQVQLKGRSVSAKNDLITFNDYSSIFI